MRKARILRRPSPALFIATAALFLALGGTGYAAFKLAKNSVGTKQLKNGAVTTKKIKNGAVTAKKINTTGLTVPSALDATNATHASSADSATNATNAANATNATNAGNAGTVGGLAVKKFSQFLPTNTASTPLADVAGITVSGACDSSGNASITAKLDPGQPTTAFNFTSSSTGSTTSPTTNGTGSLSTFNMTAATPNTVGEYVATSSANTSSGNYMARNASSAGCAFGGTIIGG
jgi:hypothetical protein